MLFAGPAPFCRLLDSEHSQRLIAGSHERGRRHSAPGGGRDTERCVGQLHGRYKQPIGGHRGGARIVLLISR